MSPDRLPDVLATGLDVVFCGTAAGTASARLGAYYAGRGNKFWPVLARTKLTPHQLQPSEFMRLLDYRIGLTDLAKADAGPDATIKAAAFDRAALEQKLQRYQPRVIAFNGKKAGQAALGVSTDYGRQSRSIVGIPVFVLPSTSGLASTWWDESKWLEMAHWLRGADLQPQDLSPNAD